MKHYKQVSQQDFDYVKELTKKGFPTRKITQVTGRSWNTIVMVQKANSLEDYRTIHRGYFQKYHPVKNPVKSVTPEPIVKEDALSRLESQLEGLKSTIADVILEEVSRISVQKTKELITSKDKEIASLKRQLEDTKEIIEAAKKSNWVDNIRKNLIK